MNLDNENKKKLFLVLDIFKLGSPLLGIFVISIILIAAVLEAGFLFLVGRFIDGNAVCLPLVNACAAKEYYFLIFVLAFIFRSVVSLYSNYILYKYSIGYVGHLSSALGKKITQLPALGSNSENSLHTIYTEASQVVNNIIHPILLIMRDIVFILAITAYIIYQYKSFAIVFFLYLFLGSFVIIMLLTPLMRSMGNKRQKLDQKRLSKLQDLSKLKHEFYLTLKSNNFVSKQFENLNEQFSLIVAKYMFVRSSNRTFLEIILFFSIVATTLSVSLEVSAKIEFYTILAVAAVRALPAITNIIGFLNSFSFHMPALLRVSSLLMGKKIKEGSGSKLYTSNSNFVELDFLNVSFMKNNEEVTKSHIFCKGSLNVIVGKSGAGKSTLLKSLIRESELFEVRVTANGLSFKKEDLLENIAYCPQEIHIVEASLIDNALVFCDKTQAKIDLAYSLMGDLEFGSSFIRRSNISSCSISGGQKRKLALLRSLLTQRPILICDEPTSELDSKSADAITRVLLKLSKSQLVIITTHDERLISVSENILEL